VVDEDAEVVEEGEVVDGLPVVTGDAGVLEQQPPAAVPAVQAAALAATGFVAGAATVVVVSRRRTKRAAKKRKKGGPFGDIVSSNSFLIDVHLLRRD
jgi:hypothetical protein